jgi:hypothetical protein
MSARLVASGMFCCGLLAGCSGMPGLENQEPAPWTQAGSPRPASEADSLLAYFEYVRKLAAVELGKEHEAARQAFQSARSDFSRVRLAMLHSLPGTAVSDEPRALELLDPVAKNPGAPLHRLAVLLAANLQERRRLDANAQGLQQKLDALRSLERSMIERKR